MSYLNLELTLLGNFLDVTESVLASSVGKLHPPELQPDFADLRSPWRRCKGGELTFTKN